MNKMLEKYLFKSGEVTKIYLKSKARIEVAQETSPGIYSNLHEWIEIEDEIDVVDIQNFHLKLRYNGLIYIYWCDMSIFFETLCLTKLDWREKQINKIIYEN